jgi:hypothetical protein
LGAVAALVAVRPPFSPFSLWKRTKTGSSRTLSPTTKSPLTGFYSLLVLVLVVVVVVVGFVVVGVCFEKDRSMLN